MALLSALGWSLLVTVSAQAAGPATGVSVALAPTSIVADGSSFTTATATVTDALSLPVLGDAVAFTATGSNVISSTTDNLNGTYTATITSTNAAGPVTITATDTTLSANGAHGTAQLTQTAGPATGVSVALAPMSIIGDGSSFTTATATVTDTNGNLVPGDAVAFTASGSNVISSTTNHLNGTYTATITSTKSAGPVTITATDTTLSANGAHGTAQLTQTSGPAGNLSLLLSFPSIRANGSDQTTATATITDQFNLPVLGQTVVFVPSDPGVHVGSVTDNLNGTYSATITASNTAGFVQVVAVDTTTPGLTDQKPLILIPGTSTTGLSLVPSQPVTNQPETILATVATTNFGSPSGSVTVENGGRPISGCQNLPVSPVSPAAACQTSFAAAGSPVPLTAVFTSSGGNLAGSTSAVDSVTVGKDSTATNLASFITNPTVGTTVTYTAAVVPTHGGSSQPSGTVQFTDGTKAVTGCAAQSIALHGSTATAVCRVTYSSASTHTITARYSGDGDFTGSTSSSIQTKVRKPTPPQPLLSTMYWQFGYNPTYTDVLSFIAYRVPAGASVKVKCHGHGCPYAKRTITVSNAKSCKPTRTLRCTKRTGNTVNLVAAFQHRRLSVGAQLRVEILRPGWVGKYYLFTMRSGHPPHAHLACLAPGSSKPGKGC